VVVTTRASSSLDVSAVNVIYARCNSSGVLSGRVLCSIHDELPTKLEEEGFDRGDLSVLDELCEHVDSLGNPIRKASFLFVALVGLHAFNDGNKRTAVIATQVFLTEQGFLLEATDDELARTSEYIQMNLGKYPMVLRDLKEETVMMRFAFEFLESATRAV